MEPEDDAAATEGSGAEPDVIVESAAPPAAPARATSFGESWAILMETWPYLVFRWGVFGLYALGCLVWFLVFGGLAYLTRKMGPVPAILFIIGVAGFGGIWWWVKRYVLYILQAGHIAVITEVIATGAKPATEDQVAYGKRVVTERFKSVNVLFAVDTLVTGVLRALGRSIFRFTQWLPIEQGQSLAKIVTEIMNRAVGYIDEAIFSHTLRSGTENPWEGARHGVLLYAQSWKPLLKSAVKLWILGKVTWFIMLIVLLIPGWVLHGWMPQIGMWIGIAVLIMAWLFTLAFYEPLALVYMILTYHRATEGVVPDPTWEGRLETATGKFTELTNKAKGWATEKLDAPAPAAKAATPE